MEVGHFHAADYFSSVQPLVATFTREMRIFVKHGDNYRDITEHIPLAYREAVIRGAGLSVQGGHPNEGKPPFKITVCPRGKQRYRSMTMHQVSQRQAISETRAPVWYADQVQHRNPSHPCKSCGSPWTQHHASTAKPGTTAMSHAYQPA